jgi:hypothetical protein
MAIVQISKIQQRSGNLVDLPQLDNAEFGWATDQHRLFIGRTGSTVSDENVEVLTSYSDISFSQIVGSDGGNFNIDTATNGQVLTYIASTNTWENYPSAAVLANASFKLNLGNANSLSISGGSIGYVLETDGYGNLSWTSKGTLRANISGLSNATPIIMTVSNTIAYQNGTSVTISGVNGVANSNVNSKTFYVKLASNFPSSGNVELYTSPDLVIGNAAIGTLLTYTNSPNAIATTALGGSGVTVAAGSNTQIQFNNSGLFGASANLTFDGTTMVVTGIANVSSNVNVTGNINLSRQLISTQATGTAPFSVASTTRVSNLNVAYANVSDFGAVTLQNTGTFYPLLGSATSGNLAHAANANLSFNAATGNLSTTLLNVTSNANVGNLGTGGIVSATGNITTGDNSYVISGRIKLTSNAAGGYINQVDNSPLVIGANGFYPLTIASGTSNTTGNITIGSNLSVTSNITGGNLLFGSGVVSGTGNVLANVLFGGALTVSGAFSGNANASTLTGNLGFRALASTYTDNVAAAGTIANAAIHGIGTPTLVASNAITTTNLSTFYIQGAPTASTNVTATNTYAMFVAAGGTYLGGTLSVAGNSNVGNLGTTGLIVATGNITGGNINTANTVTASRLISNVATGTAPLTVTSTTRVANLSVNYANVSDFEVVTAQTTGTFYPVFVSGNTSANYALGSNANISFNAATGNLSTTLLNVTGNANVGNLGTVDIVSTGNINSIGNINADTIIGTGVFGNLDIAGGLGIAGDFNAGGIVSISGGNGNTSGYTTGGAVQLRGGNAVGSGGIVTLTAGTADGTGAQIRANGGFSSGVGSGAGTGGNLTMNAGNAVGTDLPGGFIFISGGKGTGAGQPGNVIIQVATALSTGNTAQTLSNVIVVTGSGAIITGTASASANITAPQLISNVATGTAPLVVTSTTVVPNLYVARANVADFINANLVSTGTFYPLLANATSGNIAESANANLSFNAANGALSATTFVGALSGAATTAGSATTAGTVTTNAQPNITSVGTLTSLIVGNATANTTFGNGIFTATGNANTGNLGTTTAIITTGNITTINSGLLQNGNSNITLTANGNVSITAAGGATPEVVVTSTGANVNGTLTVSGNLSAANLILANAAVITVGANTNVGTITGNWTLSTGSRLQATYADLAEYYEADAHYAPGTVLEFGGEKEVTIAEDGTTRVAGVVSTDPAYAMNAKCPGIAVALALQGRVPTKVRGTVRKGDMMVSAGNGFARPWNNPSMGTVIGKALQDFDGIEGVIEVAVGRL